MTNITKLTDIAKAQDTLSEDWINAAGKKISELERAIASNSEILVGIRNQLSQAFAIKPLSGLTISVAGGNIKLPGGTIAAVAPITLAAPDNTISYVCIDTSGKLLIATIITGYAVGRIEAKGGQIISAQNYPLFEAKEAAASNFATLDDVRALLSTQAAFGKMGGEPNAQSSKILIPELDPNRSDKDGKYITVPFSDVVSTIGTLNNGGVYTARKGKYVFHGQVRVQTTNPSVRMGVKLSLFKNGDKVGEFCILQQAESARGDITLNASNAEPMPLEDGETGELRICLTSGYRCYIREGSVMRITRMPS